MAKNLTATTDKIRVITGTGADIDVECSFDELTISGGAILNDRQLTAITTATTTEILGAPASGKMRRFYEASFYNKDSISQTITILYSTGGGPTDYYQDAYTLDPGDAVSYTPGIGFYKRVGSPKLDKMLFVSADVTNATTSFADITGLTWPIEANKKYTFNCMLIHQTNATTTGAQFGVNGPAVTNLVITGLFNITQSITAAAFGSGAAVTAVDTAAVVETTGPGAVNVIGIMAGSYEPSAAGTFAVRSKSEVAVASGLIIKRGSWCHLREADS